MMDVEHELGRLLLRVAEELLEDVDHAGHEVDRVVPHDDEPGELRLRDGFLTREVDGLRLRGGHGCHAQEPTVEGAMRNNRDVQKIGEDAAAALLEKEG